MSPEIVGLIGVVLLMVLIAAGMWIGLAMAIVGFLGIVYIRGLDQALMMSGVIPYEQIAFYPIAVLPTFVLMGMVIAETGIGADLYHTAHQWIGQLRGGLAMATTGACAMLAAIVGSGMTGIIVMANVALPEMRRFNYDDRLSTGAIAASSTMGVLIPPSLAFILYGILTEQSVGKLFMAGIIPGVLEAAFYMTTIYLLCRFNPRMGPPGPKTSFKEKIFSLKGTWAMLCLFLLVMGGIYGGIFTPTEAGGVGAFGAIVIAAAGRKLNGRKLVNSLKETALMCGMIMFMIAGVFIFMHFIAVSKLAFALGEFVAGLGVPDIVIIIAIIIMYIILGCFMPEVPMVILTIPIIYPVIVTLGFDPIWFGVIIVRVMEIGSITPPMGINIFVLSGITGTPITTIFRGVIPFVISDCCHVALLVAIPALALFLPGMMR
jgi:tripartite ATP-independent transporter DctM subunit